MNDLNPAVPHVLSTLLRMRVVLVAVALVVVCASPVTGLAAPGPDQAGAPFSTAQNVDYLGPEIVAALDLGFPVLVPSWVPGPFGGSPAVDSGGGYYSLYWMNAGGEPTFLQVMGQVGGALPAGSPYDLNVQLFINANVQGYDAIHDVTPAYDAVWWIAGGVLYKVDSRNSSTDSLTLANSLVTLVPPAAPEPEPAPTSPPVSEPEPDPSGQGSNSGGAATRPPSGGDEAETTVTEANEGETSGATAPESGGDEGAGTSSEAAGTEADANEAVAGGDGDGDEDPAGEPQVASDGTGDTFYSSDGTGGAQNLILVTDGTGGAVHVIVPRQPESEPSP